MKLYEKSEEVEEIGKDIINTLPIDENIKRTKIAYLFLLREKSRFKGQIQRPGGAWQFLSDYDFVMLIHKPTWDTLNENQRKALVYHELLHITHTESKDGKITWKLRRHDIEEFLDVVKEFGNWSEELETLSKIKEE